MKVFLQIVALFCLTIQVWGALECTDWEGKSVVDGTDFHPKKEDPCYVCRCDNGQSTMCKTVSCGAPDCKYWEQIPGQCCQFKCLETEPPGSVNNGRENYTSSPPTGPGPSDTMSDATMTDLGLRLAASTVTTFLILALLLFLLHRLRQKRLRVALRRYSRRRHDLDESDNVSYSPDFFGLQCPPPYEDPPPPYSPPKPRSTHGRDQPPPYDAIDDNGNMTHVDGNGDETGNRNENQSDIAGSLGHLRNSGHQNGPVNFGGAFNFSTGHDLIDPRNFTGRSSERGNSSFNTNMNDVITSDSIQSQPYSLVHSRNVPRTEARVNSHQNGQITQGPRNVSDIGESTSSSDSCDSRSSSPVPVDYETRNTLFESKTEERQTNGNKLESGVALSEDAESTVRQFLDHQFGQMAKTRNRNFPASMSQSWTCSEQASATPHLGLAGAINRNSGHFQSHSSGTVNARKQNKMDVCQNSVPKMGIRCGKCNNIIACKCNKVKTNGLLTRSQSDYTQNATNSVPNDNRLLVRNRNLRLLHGSFGARVSYVEPEEISAEPTPTTDNHNSSQYHSDSETNISYFAPNTERISPNVSQCDDSDVPVSSRRQKLLRELRLSHLLFSPVSSVESSPSPKSPPPVNRVDNSKPKTIPSEHSAFSVCSETGEKRNARSVSDVIGNDALYPDMSNNSLVKSSLSCRNNEDLTKLLFDKPGVDRGKCVSQKNVIDINAPKRRLNFSSSTLQSLDRMTVESEEDNTRQRSGDQPRQSNAKLRNSDIVTGNNQAFNGTIPEVSHFNFGMPNMPYVSNPNVNSESCAMKQCIDKDVSKFINSIAMPHMNLMLNVGGHAGVPSVSDRANASQFYNCEHEDQVVKKSKKKLLRKRHSASSYPVERNAAARKSDSSLKHSASPRQKSATLKSKHLRQLDVSDNDQSNSDSANKSNFIAGRQYYKTIDNHKLSSVKTGPSSVTLTSSLSKAKSSAKKSQPFVEYRDDGHSLMQNGSYRSSGNGSFVMSPALDCSSFANTSAKLMPVSSCHSDTRSQSHQSKKHHKRSKSLGKDECYVGLHVGNKHADRNPGQKSSSRKKKNRQSFPGSNALHRELEHVLEKQKLAMSASMKKAIGQQRGEAGLHAVTQV